MQFNKLVRRAEAHELAVGAKGMHVGERERCSELELLMELFLAELRCCTCDVTSGDVTIGDVTFSLRCHVASAEFKEEQAVTTALSAVRFARAFPAVTCRYMPLHVVTCRYMSLHVILSLPCDSHAHLRTCIGRAG